MKYINLKGESEVNEKIYKSIIQRLKEEQKSWKTDNHTIRMIVRVALFSASERMAEEFERNNPEFDREMFVKAFSQ